MPGGTAKTLPEVIRKAVARGAADLRVALPARIEKVDLARGLADVKPLLKDFFDDGDELRSVSVPVIVNVPIVFPGAGEFRLTFPVKPGDGCLLVFSDRSLDVWISKGGEVDPVDPRRHALTDAVAILGLNDVTNAWRNVSSSAATLGHDGDGPRVEFREDEIVLDGGTQPVARKEDPVRSAEAMATWIDAVTTALAGSGAASRVPGLAAPTDFGVVNDGAERVKA